MIRHDVPRRKPHISRIFRLAALAMAAGASLTVAAGSACAQTEIEGGLQVDDADDLVPGESIWRDVPIPAHVRVEVDLDRQRAYVYRGDVLIGVTTVSSGRRGHETPVGSFRILQKDLVHKSNKYESAPMPFMERLTWGGVALHSGSVPDHPTSHGCIHLPRSFARKLYAVTKLGDVVDVQGSPTVDEEDAALTTTHGEF